MKRILFLGQKWFGERAWQHLRKKQGKNLHVVGVCSNKNPESGWWKTNAVYSRRDGNFFIDNFHRNEKKLLKLIDREGVNFILCVQHSWILSDRVLKAVNYQAMNFHNAKLPRYKGYNAVNHALLNGDSTFYCSAHWMAPKVDTGKIAYEASFPILETDTAVSLYAKANFAGFALFKKVVKDLEKDERIPKTEQKGKGTFYPRDSISNLREISDLNNKEEVQSKAKAFYFPPFEPAFIHIGGKKQYLLPESLLQTGFPLNQSEALILALEKWKRGFTFCIT